MTDILEVATFEIYDPAEDSAVIKQVGFNVGSDINVLLTITPTDNGDVKFHITAGGGPDNSADGVAEIGHMFAELGASILEGQVG